MIEERYRKNIGNLISEEQQLFFNQKTIAVVGAGGNGGYLIEALARLGPKKIILYDGDRFEESNLNRQIFCYNSTVGLNKAAIAKQQIEQINNLIDCIAFEKFFCEEDAQYLIDQNVDLILRCADIFVNIEDMSKGLLKCLEAGIPIIDSYVNVLGALVCFHSPIDYRLFKKMSADQILKAETAKQEIISQPAFLCALSAELAAGEALRYFTENNFSKISFQLLYNFFERKIYFYAGNNLIQ